MSRLKYRGYRRMCVLCISCFFFFLFLFGPDTALVQAEETEQASDDEKVVTEPEPLIEEDHDTDDVENSELLEGMIPSLKLYWGAYYKNEFSYWERSGLQEKWGDFNKIRMMFEGRLKQEITLRAELNIFSFHGNTRLFYTDHDTIILDRAYLDFRRNAFHFTIGKQEIRWGPDSLWSPTDIFQPFDLTVFHDDEREGESAFKADYTFNETFSMTGVFTPSSEQDYFRRALQLQAIIENSVLQISYLDYGEEETEKHYQFNALAVQNDYNSGKYWFETAYVRESGPMETHDKKYIKSNIGFEYITPIGILLTGELFYDGGAHSKPADYTEDEWRDYLQGRITNLGQTYAYVSTAFLMTYSLVISTGYIRNFTDHSSYYYIIGQYLIAKNTELHIGLDLTQGQKGSEFEIFGNNMSIALKIQI
ncbi:hypothetical protein JXQ70_13630 [bacterium]|nr:hypothetical protein [bacterium]